MKQRARLESIYAVPLECECGWAGKVIDAEPDCDGDGGLGCPSCHKLLDSRFPRTKWEIRPPSPKLPPLVGIQTPDGALRGTLANNGTVCVWNVNTDDDIVRGVDLRWLIASLQSILMLAEEHFGEDWGK